MICYFAPRTVGAGNSTLKEPTVHLKYCMVDRKRVLECTVYLLNTELVCLRSEIPRSIRLLFHNSTQSKLVVGIASHVLCQFGKNETWEIMLAFLGATAVLAEIGFPHPKSCFIICLHILTDQGVSYVRVTTKNMELIFQSVNRLQQNDNTKMSLSFGHPFHFSIP